MGNNIPLPLLIFGIFFCLILLICLFAILKPEPIVNLTSKYFRWSMKLYGFEAEIKPTPKAKIICRTWNLFMLLFFSIFVFLIFTGRLK